MIEFQRILCCIYMCLFDTLNCEYSRRKRENLPLPIQTPLSKILKTIFCNFIAVLKSTINFQHFEKKWTSQLNYFWNYWHQKTWLLKCIKGPVSENSSRVNVLTSPKNCWNLPKELFYPTFSSLSHIKLEFLVRSEILGLLVSTLTADYEYSRSNRNSSNGVIQKTKTCFPKYYRIFGVYINFWTFWTIKKVP